MAQKQIVWMPRAIAEYKKALQFYTERNGNPQFSQLIQTAVKRRLKILQIFPEIGHKCANEHVRILNVAGYGIFYEIENEQILILSFWDFKRNPDKRIDHQDEPI
jgi:plasmid stabilization system protein ParE